MSVSGHSIPPGCGSRVRFLFVDDPSEIKAIRAIYNDEANVASPASFIIVKQPDPTDDRGDIVFDIFLMSPRSYLWHFHRVFTRPNYALGSS